MQVQQGMQRVHTPAQHMKLLYVASVCSLSSCLAAGTFQNAIYVAQGCKSRGARRGADSRQASSASQAGSQAEQEAAPSPLGCHLKYAVTYCIVFIQSVSMQLLQLA